MPPPPRPQARAVILAGGGGAGLSPLSASGRPKALLPVCNRPLLRYALDLVQGAGLREALILCEGETAAAAVRQWLLASHVGPEACFSENATAPLSAQSSAVLLSGPELSAGALERPVDAASRTGGGGQRDQGPGAASIAPLPSAHGDASSAPPPPPPPPTQGLRWEVVRVAEGLAPAEALRCALDRFVGCVDVVLVPGDVVSDVPLRALLAAHHLHGGSATALFTKRRVLASSETKLGAAPKAVDVVGVALDDSPGMGAGPLAAPLPGEAARLVHYAHTPDALRTLRLSAGQRRAAPGGLLLRTDLANAQVYALRVDALAAAFAARPDALRSLEDHLLPFLVKQGRRAAGCARGGGELEAGALDAGVPDADASEPGMPVSSPRAQAEGSSERGRGGDETPRKPGFQGAAAAAAGLPSSSGGAPAARAAPADPATRGAGRARASSAGASPCSASALATPPPSGALAFLAPEGCYCERVRDVRSFGEVNRDAASLELAQRLLASAAQPLVAPDLALGAKAAVGAGCVVGNGCAVGDRASVKRSVLGRRCRLGAGARVINCVLMDGASVGDGAQLQNCIVCEGADVQEAATLRDCQVGPGFVVGARSDFRGETLARNSQ